MSSKKNCLLILLLFISILGILQLRSIGDFRLDDAYITFSFSKNLALGNGLLYSHGMKVEGYSNFLWMVLMALPIKIWPQADLYFIARILCAPFFILLFYSTFKITRTLSSSLFGSFAIILLAFNSDVFSAALVGLETIPYAALLSTALALYLENPQDRRAIPVMLFAALTRIDGFIPLIFIVGFELVRSIVNKEFVFKKYMAWAAPGLLIYVVWFAWRWHYYGMIFPTTYYAKSHISTALPNRGFEYAWGTFKSWGGIALLPFCAFSFFKSQKYKAFSLGIFGLLHIAYVIHVAGDWMPFERFFIPLLPLLIALFVSGLCSLNKSTRYLSFAQKTPFIVISILAFIFVAIWTCRFSVNTLEEQAKIDFILDQRNHVQKNILPASKMFHWLIKPGEKLVSDYAGVFAVFTDARVIDMWGLCNKEVALRGTPAGVNPIWGLSCPQCYAEENPDYFHVWKPLMRPINAYPNQAAVISNIWQSDRIQHYLDLQNNYVTGRIIDTTTQMAAYFLERRRPEANFQTKYPAPNIVIDYPFLNESEQTNLPN